MKLEVARPEDAEMFAAWVCAKMDAGYEVRIEDLKLNGNGIMFKIAECFFCPARYALFEGKPAIRLGPLVPRPGIPGRSLVVALRRMIREIQLEFQGDIVYPNLSENGVDAAARIIGGFEDVVTEDEHLMVLRGTSV